MTFFTSQMKACALLLLVCGALVAGTVGSAHAEEQNGEKKHLVWDPVDQLNRCLGSPINCDF